MPSRKVEQKNFCVAAARNPDCALAFDTRRITRAQRRLVDADVAARDMDVGAAAGDERVSGRLRTVEHPGVEACILMNRHGAAFSGGCGEQRELPTLGGWLDARLLVRRGNAPLRRLDPDLQEMH